MSSARLHPILMSFAAGELSPRMRGRVDLAKYMSGAKQLLNWLVLPQGGVTRRPGTRYVAAVKTAASLTLVRDFIFSPTQAYVLEIGAGYIRFFKDGAQITSGGSPVEVSTPYTAADLRGIDFTQSADVLYFFHASYPTRKLERYSDTVWKFRVVNWTPPPTQEYGARPVADLEPGALSGDNVTFYAPQPAFLNADVNREIVVTTGTNAGARGGIKSFTDTQHVVVTICDAWTNTTGTCGGYWKITGSPLTTCQPSAKDPVGAAATLTLAAAGWRGTTGLGDSDCGRYAMVHGGQFEITGFTSTTVANSIIRGTASATSAASSGAWSLEESLWSAANGYAETGDFFDDRLYASAAEKFAGSKAGDFENFGVGVVDDDAVIFSINSKTVNRIRAIVGAGDLQIFTAGAEYIAKGGSDNPITPTNVTVENQTNHGSGTVGPVRVDDATIIITRSGRRVRDFLVRADSISGSYSARDLMILADHLTQRATPTGADLTLLDMAFQREPDPRLWVVRSDGVLLGCTYLQEQNVVAWHRHITGPDAQETTPSKGKFESVCVIPHPDGDREQVWVTVLRTIGGVTKRYVEYLDDDGLSYASLNTDCAWTCDSATAITALSGLSHLEGETVTVVGDGGPLPDCTVASGNITISRASKKIEVGLGYTSALTTMEPEVQVGNGSSRPLMKRWVEIFVELVDTLGLTLGTEDHQDLVPFRLSSDVLNEPPPLYTGKKRLSYTAWDDARVVIKQTQPLPATVIAISGTMEIGG